MIISKKIISVLSLFIFSILTIDLQGSWTEKVARVKSSFEKVTFKDTIDYTTKVALVVVGIAVIVELWSLHHKLKDIDVQLLNLEVALGRINNAMWLLNSKT
ncbi:hypothetical protein E3J79_01050 [Candidatus Dependentiae bacterium]|nr:MAG: hypothetical protein E3J79_01050 [Candidatus Dependentiae bacterium]